LEIKAPQEATVPLSRVNIALIFAALCHGESRYGERAPRLMSLPEKFAIPRDFPGKYALQKSR
jgi:hypothetical protein